MGFRPCNCGCGLSLFAYQRKNAKYRKSQDGTINHYIDFHNREKREIYRKGKGKTVKLNSDQMYRKRAEKLLEKYQTITSNYFLDKIRNEIEIWIDMDADEKIGFRFVLDCIRYRYKFKFPNPCGKYFKKAFVEKYPEMIQYIK